MRLGEAILLGLVQGVTEFLPVSSSAHLVAAQKLLGMQAPGILLEVSLHLGTLLAVLLIFGRALWRTAADGLTGTLLHLRGAGRAEVEARAPWFAGAVAVVIGTVPVVVAGVAVGDLVERAFDSCAVAGALLIVTGLVLAATRLAPARGGPVTPGRGLAIGLAQAAALLPGISRSGATISAGLLLGVERGAAAEFSFLLLVPATLGAAGWEAVKHLRSGAGWGGVGAAPVVVATLVAAAVGAVSLTVLVRLVRSGRLHWFAAYCVPAGVAILLLGIMG